MSRVKRSQGQKYRLNKELVAGSVRVIYEGVNVWESGWAFLPDVVYFRGNHYIVRRCIVECANDVYERAERVRTKGK